MRKTAGMARPCVWVAPAVLLLAPLCGPVRLIVEGGKDSCKKHTLCRIGHRNGLGVASALVTTAPKSFRSGAFWAGPVLLSQPVGGSFENPEVMRGVLRVLAWSFGAGIGPFVRELCRKRPFLRTSAA